MNDQTPNQPPAQGPGGRIPQEKALELGHDATSMALGGNNAGDHSMSTQGNSIIPEQTTPSTGPIERNEPLVEFEGDEPIEYVREFEDGN